MLGIRISAYAIQTEATDKDAENTKNGGAYEPTFEQAAWPPTFANRRKLTPNSQRRNKNAAIPASVLCTTFVLIN